MYYVSLSPKAALLLSRVSQSHSQSTLGFSSVPPQGALNASSQAWLKVSPSSIPLIFLSLHFFLWVPTNTFLFCQHKPKLFCKSTPANRHLQGSPASQIHSQQRSGMNCAGKSPALPAGAKVKPPVSPPMTWKHGRNHRRSLGLSFWVCEIKWVLAAYGTAR